LVKKGQVLLRTEKSTQEANLVVAEKELKLALAQFTRIKNGAHYYEKSEALANYRTKLAQSEYAKMHRDRAAKLVKSMAVSQEEYDNAVKEVESLENQVLAAKAKWNLIQEPREDDLAIEQSRVDAAKSRVDLAKTNLAYTELKSPIDGKITKIDVRVGEYIDPALDNTPRIILTDTSELMVRAFVEELDAPNVKMGTNATVKADGMKQEFYGKVISISPQMSRKSIFSDRPTERFDTKTREIIIKLDTESKDLLIGLRVEATIKN
jgi:multidrug resistance efflux pump